MSSNPVISAETVEPLVPLFEFKKIIFRDPYAFASVHVSVEPEDKTLGFFTAKLIFPIRVAPGETVDQVRDRALALAGQTVDVSAILPSLRACR